MKNIIMVLLFLSSTIFVWGQQQASFSADKDTVTEEAIKKLEYLLADLIEKGDADTYAAYLTNDYIRIGANGVISTKQQIIESLRRNVKPQVKMIPYDLHVRVYGSTAILIAKLNLETTTGDRIENRSSVITKVFIKKNDKWYMASMHGSTLQ